MPPPRSRKIRNLHSSPPVERDVRAHPAATPSTAPRCRGPPGPDGCFWPGGGVVPLARTTVVRTTGPRVLDRCAGARIRTGRSARCRRWVPDVPALRRGAPQVLVGNPMGIAAAARSSSTTMIRRRARPRTTPVGAPSRVSTTAMPKHRLGIAVVDTGDGAPTGVVRGLARGLIMVVLLDLAAAAIPIGLPTVLKSATQRAARRRHRLHRAHRPADPVAAAHRSRTRGPVVRTTVVRARGDDATTLPSPPSGPGGPRHRGRARRGRSNEHVRRVLLAVDLAVPESL